MTERAKVRRTAHEKTADQARGMKYGCHVEIGVGEMPDDCVKDMGDEDGCIYARRHKTREGCKYWQPKTAKVVA